MRKCINCDKKIGEKFWCSVECKQEFLEKNYTIAQVETALVNMCINK